MTTWLVFFIGCTLSGAFSIMLGSDGNWDLLNYHWYNAYAFVSGGRFDFDIAPAQMQTYYNPLLDLPFWYIVNGLSPKVAGFVLGALHGLCVGLVYLIAKVFIKSRGLSLLCASMAFMSPMWLAGLGSSMGDNLVAIFILLGIYLLVMPLNDKRGFNFLFSSYFIGVAIALKLTSGIFMVGISVALLLSARKQIKNTAIFLCGCCAMFLAYSLPWMYEMWKRFDNPFFPLFNNIFHSAWALPLNFSDNRFLPKTFLDALFYPFHFFIKSKFIWMSNDVSDCRYAIIYVLFIALGIKFLLKKSLLSIGKESVLLWIFFITYLLWQLEFCQLRYIVSLELLSPIVVVIITSLLVKRKSLLYLMIFLLFGTIVYFAKIPNYDRSVWGDKYLSVNVPELPKPDETLVVMSGQRPLSYLIPYFNPEIGFINIHTNFTKPGQPTKIEETIQSRIKNHSGDIYLMCKTKSLPMAFNDLLQYRLTLADTFGCVEVVTKQSLSSDPYKIMLWKLKKTS